MTEWKREHANACDAAIDHPIVQRAIDALLDNLGASSDGLVRYGVNKVAHYAAQVARAQASGIDPDSLRMTGEEANSALTAFAAEAVGRGVPIQMIDSEETTL